MTTAPPAQAIANWGPMVASSDVDDQILLAMKQWMPTYLKQLAAARNLSFKLALPRTYSATFMGQEFLDHQLPAVISITAQATAVRGGRNMPYEATWAIRLATVVRGKRPPVTRFLASLYELAQRLTILQKASANPPKAINSIHWQGMRYEEVPDSTGQGRYALAAISVFEAFSDMAVQPFAGPSVPDAGEYVGEATITEVDIEVLGDKISVTS